MIDEEQLEQRIKETKDNVIYSRPIECGSIFVSLYCLAEGVKSGSIFYLLPLILSSLSAGWTHGRAETAKEELKTLYEYKYKIKE